VSHILIRRVAWTVADLLRSIQVFQLDPGYQREGGIWTRDRQQLFIDSILNGFDVPPLYLHRLQPPEFVDDVAATYAVIDGRQRLEALTGFADNRYGLSPDFRLLEEVEDAQPALTEELALPPSRYAGLRYSELMQYSPPLAYRYSDYQFPVTVVETADPDVIEELFFRLNEGVPLTSAEKRSRGALLREVVLPLIHEEEIFRAARFRGKRRAHEDLLIRLLYLADVGAHLSEVPDLKKRALDDFAASFRPALGQTWNPAQEAQVRARLDSLLDQTVPVLRVMNDTFYPDDPLLSTVNNFTAHYLVIQRLIAEGSTVPPREPFDRFAQELASLRGLPEEDLTDDQVEALDFALPIQGSTTGSYFSRKATILYRFIVGDLRIR